jgi:integrase
MKRIKGNPSYIVRHLMHEVEVHRMTDEDGHQKAKIKRHEQKKVVKEKLKNEGKACSQADVAKQMPIYSFKTKNDYATSWRRFFTFIADNHNVKDIDRVKVSHVKSYLTSLINSEIRYSTFKTACASLSKLEVALNKTRRNPLCFSEQLKTYNGWARKMLPSGTQSRAYKKPQQIIMRLDGKAKIAAELQLYGGARISEILELKLERNFQGINGNSGIIRLTNTKGGRIRDIKVPIDTYSRALACANEEGKFQLNDVVYINSLKKASRDTFQTWNGSHGFRWNFAQNKFREYQDIDDKTPDEALLLVAQDLGHSRPGITRLYLS